jgi:hypothetical protein
LQLRVSPPTAALPQAMQEFSPEHLGGRAT